MEIFEYIGLVLDGLLISLTLLWILWGLGRTFGIWPSETEQDLINDGDLDDGGGEVDPGTDGSGWDFGGGFGGFL